MKGLVFTEFMDMVDQAFSVEVCENLIDMSNLPSKGVYTSVGTYNFSEMETLVSNLSKLTGTAISDLLKSLGEHLFGRFLAVFPDFFSGFGSSFEFLPRVQSYVHLEVCKLYPDAELPAFSCDSSVPGRLLMTYRSTRNIPDLAEGLIRACISHFGESIAVTREDIGGPMSETRFVLSRRN